MSSGQQFALVPAAYVFLRRADHVLLQLRQNTGYMDGHWVAGAAGHLCLGETAAECAAREAEEELGVRVGLDSLTPMTVMQRTDGTDCWREQRVDWFFLTDAWKGEPVVGEPQKCARIAWFDLGHLPAPMSPYERWVLEEFSRGSLAPVTSYGFQRP